MGTVYVRSEGLRWERECNMCGKKYSKLYTVLSYRGVVYLLYMVYCCSCLVRIVVVVLCVLL